MIITVDIGTIIGSVVAIVILVGAIFIVLIKFIILLAGHVCQLIKEKLKAICKSDEAEGEVRNG